MAGFFAASLPEILGTAEVATADLPPMLLAGDAAAADLGTVGTLDAASAIANGMPSAVAGLESTAANALSPYDSGIMGADAAAPATAGSAAVPMDAAGAVQPNMGQVISPDTGNAVPGAAATQGANANVGAGLSPVSPVAPSYNTSIGQSMGAVADPVKQGFSDAFDMIGKGSDWVEKHKTSAMLGLMGASRLFGPSYAQPTVQKPTGKAMDMTLASNFAPSRMQSNSSVYNPSYPSYAGGGIADLAAGGQMTPNPANVDFMGGDMYPQSQQQRSFYATPTQMPTSAQQSMASYEPNTNPLTGEATVGMAAGGILAFKSGSTTTTPDDSHISYLSAESPWKTNQDTDANTAFSSAQEAAAYRQKKLENLVGFANRSKLAPQMALGQVNQIPAAQQYQQAAMQAQAAAQPQAAQGAPVQEAASGGIMGYSLGGYATGGNPRLLKGPGDGMSDNIPAVIADKQPARLANNEFVVPADVVSHLGNGSTDAGAKQLHDMMDRVRKARTGSKKQGKQIDPDKFLPA